MSSEVVPKTPIDQFYDERTESERFAFVDFLLATPRPTEEQIFERIGIRLSDFDFEEDGETYHTSADEFRDEVIGDELQDNAAVQEIRFIDPIRAAEPLYPVGEKWTAVELFQLFRALKDVFEPTDPTWIAVLTGIQVSLPEVLAKPQPAGLTE